MNIQATVLNIPNNPEEAVEGINRDFQFINNCNKLKVYFDKKIGYYLSHDKNDKKQMYMLDFALRQFEEVYGVTVKN